MTGGRRRRRLLFLLPFAPRLDATHGGSRVIAELLYELTGRHEVAIVYLRARDEPPLDKSLRGRCRVDAEVERPPIAGSVRRRVRRSVVRGIGLLRREPVWVGDWRVPEFDEQVRRVALSWAPDIVQVEYHVMAQYLSVLEGVSALRVLVPHEAGAEAASAQWRSSRGMARPLRRLDARAWETFERRILQQVDAVVAFTERDREALARRAPGTSTFRIPFATRLPDSPLDPVGRRPPTIVFVGSFSHPPNVEAAVRLATSIHPRVRRRIPDARLLLVGDTPSKKVERLRDTSVLVTGRVADVVPYLDAAAVVAAPVRLGGGMRVKVVEALAYGKALVASRLALEGLDVTHGEEVLVAESDEDFSDALVGLLRDERRRGELAMRARLWATVNLSWERTADLYDDLYEELLEPPDGPAPR